jgi:UDP-N-acetylmuramoyl-L-alanyl-D-glutamate--2,6-diaminopimelate ligase
MTQSREMSLQKLLAGIIDVPAGVDMAVQGIAIDSRNCTPGCAFLACAGLSSHGLEYVDQALRLGARAILWEPDGVDAPSLPEGVVALPVAALSRHAGELAARFHGYPVEALDVIGVTGTNGKTSVAHLVARALGHLGRRAAVAGTLGNGFPDELHATTHTTMDAVSLQALLADLRDAGADSLAMEVSSHALSQHRVAGMRFHTAVFTNLTRDHLDYHGDLESYAAAKRRLFDMPELQVAVVNADDAVGRDILASLPTGTRRIAFASHAESLRDTGADDNILITNIEFDAGGLQVMVDRNEKNLLLKAPLFGRFNALNLVAVFGVLLGFGYSDSEAVRALAGVRPVPGRMEHLGGGALPLVIVDYAHTPDALRQVLLAAREHVAGRVVCVFGCGGDRDRGKRPEMAEIAEGLADLVVVTDDNPRTEDGDAIVAEIVAGLKTPDAATVERDRAKAIHLAVRAATRGDVVVLAGKGHEDYQVVGNERRYFSDRETAQQALEAVA